VPSVERFREDLKPIEITQPEGPSFTVDGHAVSWQKWQVRIGFTPREGLGPAPGELRGPLDRPPRLARRDVRALRATPAPTHRFKNVFDQGEYGVGWLANSLVLGCDCVGHIEYFDGVVNDNDGGSVVIPNAICMHEEDAGIGWKHMDFRTEATQVRRAPSVGDLLRGHSRQLRVRVLLVPVHRRHDRVRDQAHRRDLDRRDRGGGRRRGTARWSRRVFTGRTTSTSSAFAWTWRWTARRTPWSRSTRCPARPGRTTCTATRGRPAAPCWRTSRRRARDIDTGARALLEDRERRAEVGVGRADRPTR
jgi:hypothetical protein